jgi:hypothetical protein
VRSSISCIETKFDAISDFRRVSVASDNLALAGEIGACLQQLLVEVRRLDFGDHLPGLDLRADIGAPAFQVAADARKDRRAIIGLQPARQIQGGVENLGVGQHHGDRRDSLVVGPFAQLRAGIFTGPDTGNHHQQRGDDGHNPENAQLPARDR